MFLIRLAAFGVLLAVAGNPARPGATVSGVVALPEKTLKPSRPGRYPGEKPGPSEYVRGPAVVFIDKVPGTFTPSAKVVMEQKGRQYSPLALPILAGTTVEFPNRDEEYHQVFSNSRAKEMDLGRYAPGVVKEEPFPTPGLVRLRCDIHRHMHAVILVLENPYFAVCDEKGAFSIPNVPAGTYMVYAFHENYEPKTPVDDPLRAVGRKIEVSDSGTVKTDFDLK